MSTKYPLNAPVLEDATSSMLRAQICAYIDMDASNERGLDALVSQLWENGEENIFNRANMAGHITSSVFVLSPDFKQVLAVNCPLTGALLLPGGHVHEQEQQVNLREQALYELFTVSGMADIDPVYLEDKTDVPLDIASEMVPTNPLCCEGAHLHHDFLYLGRAWRLQPDTLRRASDAQWVDVQSFFDAQTSTRWARVRQKLQSVLGEE